MIVSNGVGALQVSFYNLLSSTVAYLPALLFAIILLLIGWFVAVWLGWVVAEAIRAVRVDHALKQAGVDEVVARAGYHLDSGAFLGALVKWFVILVFFVAALNVLQLTQVSIFLQSIVVGYLPNVIIAVLILLAGAVIAQAAEGVIAGSARAAGIVAAGFVGTLARWAIWIFAILTALYQLQIATAILQTLFTGVVVGLALAFGLAFGLGGQEAAARFIEKTRAEMQSHRRQ
ncbi:MAG: hypothetical protein QG621_228 [Patescibacteria group bacterium]|jgi:hypothetical protein|nr:hypothetical protein [Patescibacteria group bacterium]